MELIKKHYETLTILGGMAVGLIVACLWLNGKFNDVNTRLTKIETVLIMRGIMPQGMVASTEEKKGG